jgi:hypothetical protein
MFPARVEESIFGSAGENEGEEDGTPDKGGGTKEEAFEDGLFVKSHQPSTEYEQESKDDEGGYPEAPIDEEVG